MLNKISSLTIPTKGGDWGSWISRAIAIQHPEACKGFHVTLLQAPEPREGTKAYDRMQKKETEYSAREKRALENSKKFLRSGSGYQMVQSTQPAVRRGYGSMSETQADNCERHWDLQ